MRPLSATPEVDTEVPQTQRASKKVCRIVPFRTTLERALAFVTLILLLICAVVIALLAVQKGNENVREADKIIKTCSFSEEAKRVDLEKFLQKVQDTYYEHEIFEWLQGTSFEDHIVKMETRYRPMNFTPEYFKERTDASLSLFDEIQGMDIDELKLKPREAKGLYQLKHFLRTTFASPYDANFYSGDWMLGPNHFCWQSLCFLGYDLNQYSIWVKPKDLDGLERILDMIYQHGEAVKQYQSNMRLGVKSGMVRSVYNCKSGLNAFKQHFKKTTKDNNPNDILEEPHVKRYREELYIEALSDDDTREWLRMKGKTVSASIDEALVEGIGRPLIDFVKYLEDEHMGHCLPRDLSSGLAGLPVDFIYIDGVASIIPTTKVLPITGQKLNGKENYKNILPYFTTSDIMPDEIYKIGQEILAALYPQAIEIARNITGESDNETAIREFKKLLNSSEEYFNDGPFPANESDAAAFKNCSDIESAKLNCPTRWAAMLKWANYGHQTLAILAPKLISMFYHTGNKITIPNCPLEIRPNFNPSFAIQSYSVSSAGCQKPAFMNIPFFVKKYGPKYSDWSVVAHEGWPGHHTQMQGLAEYFTDQCEDVLKWLDSQSGYSFFREGWALYAEKPVISEDTDTYDGYPLQKYGMLQWQIWRALRLIVDTGLHYRGMNRTEALELFSKYAWEDGEIAQKEVTRYQGGPGQATAYKLGQQKITQMRDYCEQELGDKFDLREFHYQILSTGSATEKYIDKHIKQYVKCTVDDLDEEVCDYILYPMPKSKTHYPDEGYEPFRRSRPFPARYA